MNIGTDYATCVRVSRVIVSILYPIGLCFSIDNYNRCICTKGQNVCIIQSIDASEASENSRVVPGYGEMCSEANLAVRFTKSEAKNQKRQKYVILQALKQQTGFNKCPNANFPK